MKKYIVKDNLGNKKTIYANDLSHALTFVDSKVKDDIDAVRIVGIRYNKYVVMDKTATKVLSPKFDDVDDAYSWIKKNYPRAKVLDSKIKDEASLATTINALVNDEKAAADAYNVAIKNLEGSIDDTARQVLINIRDDERRHIENLYSILNGQVTEKNLKDSIHDAVKSPSAYVNTRLVKNMLPNDLMAEGLKNDYSFNDVLKNFDAISSQILDVVKDALDEAKRDIIDFKRNYINALIN